MSSPEDCLYIVTYLTSPEKILILIYAITTGVLASIASQMVSSIAELLEVILRLTGIHERISALQVNPV